MGGSNVREWTADTCGMNRLTIGGSWWHGEAQTQVDGGQWKPALVFERSIDAGHNDLYERPAYAAAMREALARVESAGHALRR
jgi:hypothetical protein